MIFYNNKLKTHARKLRKGMTDAEIKMWSAIRMKQLNGCRFYRQRIIGGYLVDFFSPKARLVIEIDGSQHFEIKAIEEDQKRDKYIKIRGYKVLRYDDIEVLTNIDGVTEDILENMKFLR
jgi:very-short-patch-repair endonuclease